MSFAMPLSDIFPVSVTVSPTGSPGPSFRQALIVGPSTVISSVTDRVKQYTSVSSMLTDTFAANSAEVLAATVYFGQGATRVAIGRQDLTAISAVALGAVAGTGYAAGDIVTVVQSGAQAGEVKVLTVTTGGVPATVAIVQGIQGTGYSTATNLSTTGGTGTGLEINITAIGETPLQAVHACRTADGSSYIIEFVGTASDSDHLAIAAYAEAASPVSQYHVTTSEASVLATPSANLPVSLQTAKYRRTMVSYATTQSSAFPNNIYLAAGAAGFAMARNTGAAGSYFSLNDKTIAGIAPEPLTASQILAIRGTTDRSSIGMNCNIVVPYINGQNFFQPGIMSSGDWFDRILNLDMLVASVQAGLMGIIPNDNPLTNTGIALMKNVISKACQNSQAIGYIAPSGTWLGITVGTGPGAIESGDALSKGYAVYAPPVTTLSEVDRNARRFPPITVLLIEAQSGASLAVAINVQP